jgi:hypothetical protein
MIVTPQLPNALQIIDTDINNVTNEFYLKHKDV